MEKVSWKVEGMSCTNCALTIHKYLEKKGLGNVKVNFIGGDVSFDINGGTSKPEIEKGIESLGYHVVHSGGAGQTSRRKFFLKNHLQRFLFCLVFTAPMLLTMIPGLHLHALMDPYVQLALTIPVFIVGMNFFGRSAIKSLLRSIPNMNVLIALGSMAAFVYSLYGT